MKAGRKDEAGSPGGLPASRWRGCARAARPRGDIAAARRHPRARPGGVPGAVGWLSNEKRGRVDRMSTRPVLLAQPGSHGERLPPPSPPPVRRRPRRLRDRRCQRHGARRDHPHVAVRVPHRLLGDASRQQPLAPAAARAFPPSAGPRPARAPRGSSRRGHRGGRRAPRRRTAAAGPAGNRSTSARAAASTAARGRGEGEQEAGRRQHRPRRLCLTRTGVVLRRRRDARPRGSGSAGTWPPPLSGEGRAALGG